MTNDERKQWSRRLRAATLSFPCKLCGAKPGEPCLTNGGTNPVTEHSLRRRQGHHKVNVEDGLYTKKS